MEADDYPVEVILKEAPFPPTLPTLKPEEPKRISPKHA